MYHVKICGEDTSLKENDANEAPKTFEEGKKSTIDELKEVDLGGEGDPHPIYVNANLTSDEEES